MLKSFQDPNLQGPVGMFKLEGEPCLVNCHHAMCSEEEIRFRVFKL